MSLSQQRVLFTLAADSFALLADLLAVLPVAVFAEAADGHRHRRGEFLFALDLHRRVLERAAEALQPLVRGVCQWGVFGLGREVLVRFLRKGSRPSAW